MTASTKENAYLLGNATLMLGRFGVDDVFTLTPALHSVGMCKNVTVGEESDSVELRHGVFQHLVDSKKSNVRTTISAEVYEYSAANIIRSLSLNQAVVAMRRGVLTTELTTTGTSVVYNSDPVPGVTGSAITTPATDVPSGSTLLLQKVGEDTDYVIPIRTTANASGSGGGPFTSTIAAFPTGMTFPVGSKVWVVNEIGVATTAEQSFYCAKIVGTMSNNDRPVTIILPKVKINRGFQINFSETGYGNMPFELAPYFLSASEVSGRLSEIGTSQQGKVYVA